MLNFFGYLQWYDYIRILTMLFCLWTLYVSGKRAFLNWRHFSTGLKELWWIINFLIFLLFEGTLENLILNAAWGPRVLLGLIISVVAFRSVYRDGGFIKDELLYADRKRNGHA